MTKAEFALWLRLREANAHGFKFRRQHPIGAYIADFAHIRGKLVVEVDGATHWTQDQLIHDRRRDDFLRKEGWTVLRVANQTIFENIDGVVEQILRRLTPHPETPTRFRPLP
jgi:very-short-patch-repair endonuclease